MTSTATSLAADVLLDVRDLRTYFPVRRGLFGRTVGYVRAVDGVSFALAPGKTLGLVGESGCGKTTTGRTILRLIPATAGSVRFAGQDVFSLPAAEMRSLRQNMQIIFQDPYGSLNPRMTIGGIIGEPLKVHGRARGKALEDRVADLLDRVGLSPAYCNRYPHEFSGGQRQRIGIARALALDPRLIVCDEPVSALDVSIQAQILNLLEQLQADLGLAYLFIAHDLAVVSHISDDVAVMYLGKLVEQAPSRSLYENPLHPYTKCLMSAIPKSHPDTPRERIVPLGEVPSATNPPPGCPFHPRCPWVMDRCRTRPPVFAPMPGDTDHVVACHLHQDSEEGP
ncbi:MAG TPA: dipeptide ABC transporter ATP-binding protein [Phycisphaerae bacterium]|nr:dipeptide ABC transporter ATP-binding protein [Phycisphaerae bacterium]